VANATGIAQARTEIALRKCMLNLFEVVGRIEEMIYDLAHASGFSIYE
jgi:hypothetical protein